MRILQAITLLLAVGCSATMKVEEITGKPAGSVVHGIPFRTKAYVTARIFKKTGAGYQEVHVQPMEFADMSRLYALGFDAKLLADHTFVVHMNEDGTLQSADLKVVNKAATGLGNLGEALDTTVKALDDKRKAEESAREAAEKEKVDKENALLAAVQARHQAEAAQDQLDALPGNTPPDELAAARRALEAARLNANVLARRAGLSPPYPDVGFGD